MTNSQISQGRSTLERGARPEPAGLHQRGCNSPLRPDHSLGALAASSDATLDRDSERRSEDMYGSMLSTRIRKQTDKAEAKAKAKDGMFGPGGLTGLPCTLLNKHPLCVCRVKCIMAPKLVQRYDGLLICPTPHQILTRLIDLPL